MRHFRIVALGGCNTPIMTSIMIDVPDYIELSEPNPAVGIGVQAASLAVGYVVGRLAEEFVRYAASECLLSEAAE